MGQGVASPTQNAHPALARFAAWEQDGSRLLLIRAAAGTGRRLFARSWVGGRRGEVHDWSGNHLDEVAELETLAMRMHREADLHAAVILPPSAPLWDLASVAPFVLAEQHDLLLDAREIAQLAEPGRPIDPDQARAIHELCGGWLGAARVLAAEPGAHARAQHLIRTGLAPWLRHHDPRGELSEAAFLPQLDAQTVEAFFGQVSPEVHVMEDLSRAGLVQADGSGGWMMPALVRQVLMERVGLLGRERIGALEQGAVDAMAETSGVGPALKAAVDGRRWPAILNLLLEKWVDMFMANPKHLAAVAAKVPRFVSGQTHYMRVGLRILGSAGKDGMVLHLPSLAPDYATDSTAQRLREDTERLYRTPNARALTIGMLEISHLRLAGLYEEAGGAAQRLREALSRGLDTQRLNPSLAALVEFHSGLTLHLAGCDAEAVRAYETGFRLAQASGKAFLVADVAGKLALFHALEGNGDSARRWLAEHEAAIAQVGWGRKMIAHTATLARAFLDMADLRFGEAARELGGLPQTPGNDEFWSVHAYLLVMQSLQGASPESARRLIDAWRTERRYACAAPLADRLLDEALLLAEIIEAGGCPSRHAGARVHPALVAFGHLVGGEPDKALTMLRGQQKAPATRRWEGFALFLDVAARNPGPPRVQVLQQLKEQRGQRMNLVEIALLRMIPGWADVVGGLQLEPEELDRLEMVAAPVRGTGTRRPVLTPREQEVLRQLRMGMSRREIAEAGFRSENTVKTQIRSLYRKLGATDVAQALEHARERGI